MAVGEPDAGKWGDLQVRLISALVLLVMGLTALIVGGVWFKLFVSLAAGLLIWELAQMCDPERSNAAIVLGVLAASICSIQEEMGGVPRLSLFTAIPILGFVAIRKNQIIFLVFATFIGLATFSLVALRNEYGIVLILWAMLVIIASDTLGYLVGRLVGGPKFWPKISPKKTWSGTVAGWVGAACVGGIFLSTSDGGLTLIAISVAVAFAGQMGDIVESALKRHVGIKDSSDLIPGHGGVFDRFDAMLAAFFLLGFIEFVWHGAIAL